MFSFSGVRFSSTRVYQMSISPYYWRWSYMDHKLGVGLHGCWQTHSAPSTTPQKKQPMNNETKMHKYSCATKRSSVWRKMIFVVTFRIAPWHTGIEKKSDLIFNLSPPITQTMTTDVWLLATGWNRKVTEEMLLLLQYWMLFCCIMRLILAWRVFWDFLQHDFTVQYPLKPTLWIVIWTVNMLFC